MLSNKIKNPAVDHARKNSFEPTKTLSFRSLLHNRRFRLNVFFFIISNVLLYVVILNLHGLVAFNRYEYLVDAHHFYTDGRLYQPSSFNMFRSLGQYDAQYYLEIAATGYHKIVLPLPRLLNQRAVLNTLSYAYLPAYPAIVALVNVFIRSPEISAFVVSQILMLMGFCLVYWLVAKWFTPQLATKTSWLVFLYPFSIFYRSYFSEGLFLVLLVVLLDNLLTKRWLATAIAAGALSVTRLIGFVGVIILFWRLMIEHQKHAIKLSFVALIVFLALLPLLVFITICYYQTGNPFYFLAVHSNWYMPQPPIYAFFWSVAHFKTLPWDLFHHSRLDVLSIIVFGILIVYSRNWLPKPWWYVSLLLWLIPVLTLDTMSASRYQIINLPVFIYVAHMLPKRSYLFTITCCAIVLCIVAILFVNWVWIG